MDADVEDDPTERIYDAAEMFVGLRVKMAGVAVHLIWAREFRDQLSVLIDDAERALKLCRTCGSSLEDGHFHPAT